MLDDPRSMKESLAGIGILQCPGFGTCQHRSRVIRCHATCGGPVVAASSSSHTALLKVLAYTCEPLPSEPARRMRWLRQRFVSSLENAKPRLPLETRLEIAELLQGNDLHRLVMAPRIHTLLEGVQSDTFQVTMSAEIWARFVSFEGIRYISSLSNSRGDHHSQSIYSPDPSEDVNVVYVAETQLGVTQIVFSNSSRASVFEDGNGHWWKVIRLIKRNPVLIAKTDVGIFLCSW